MTALVSSSKGAKSCWQSGQIQSRDDNNLQGVTAVCIDPEIQSSSDIRFWCTPFTFDSKNSSHDITMPCYKFCCRMHHYICHTTNTFLNSFARILVLHVSSTHKSIWSQQSRRWYHGIRFCSCTRLAWCTLYQHQDPMVWKEQETLCCCQLQGELHIHEQS